MHRNNYLKAVNFGLVRAKSDYRGHLPLVNPVKEMTIANQKPRLNLSPLTCPQKWCQSLVSSKMGLRGLPPI